MSQYGAEGAARQGLTTARSLAFYYPGTERGTSAGRVTVQLSADTTDDLVVSARHGPHAPRHRRRRAGHAARQRRLPLAGRGRQRRRQPGLLPAPTLAPVARAQGPGRVLAGGDPITLVTPAGRARLPRPAARRRDVHGRPGHGQRASTWRATSRASCRWRSRRSWSAEAVQAQAVAARTYASYERAAPALAALPALRHLVLPGLRRVRRRAPRLEPGRRRHRRQILTSGGEPAFTQFGSSSGGWTAAGSVPYLPATGGPVRRLVGQPGARLVGEGRRRPARAGLARGRRPAPDRGDRPRRQRRLGRPGPPDRAARHRRPGRRQPATRSGPCSACARPGLTFSVARR